MDGDGGKALPFRTKPCFELWRDAIDALEEVSAIEARGFVWCRPLGRQPRERDGVDFDNGRIKGHGIAVSGDRIKPDMPERLPDGCQGLPQAIACLSLGAVAPEQARKAVARQRPASRKSEVGQ